MLNSRESPLISKMSKLLALILLFPILFPTCRSTHFRGAIFMWKPTGKHMEIEVDFRISWRRSDTFCNESIVTSRMLIHNSHSYLECHKNCRGIMDNLYFYCTDFSSEDEWTSGKRSFRYVFPSNHMDFEFGFSGGNWIDLVTGVNRLWSFSINVDLTNRPDKGRANSSPRTDMFPLVRLAYGCNHTIVIPVYDVDGDNVRCRWANGITECAGVCSAFPRSILHQDDCTVTYSAIDKVGYYAVAIQVEDFRSIDSRKPLSSVPIQFLVYIYSSSEPCDHVPVFLPPTKSDKTVVPVQVYTTVTEKIVARSGVKNTRITEITTTSPQGMKKSLLLRDPSNQGAWYINVTWKPTETDVSSTHFLCFSASDEKRLTSAIRCIHFSVIQEKAMITTTASMKTVPSSIVATTVGQEHLPRKTLLSSTTTTAKLVQSRKETTKSNTSKLKTTKDTTTTIPSIEKSTPTKTNLLLTGNTTKLSTGTLGTATTITSAGTTTVTTTNLPPTSRSRTTTTTISTTRKLASTTSISPTSEIPLARISSPSNSTPSNATPIKTNMTMPTPAKIIPTPTTSAGQTTSTTTKFPSTTTSTKITSTIRTTSTSVIIVPSSKTTSSTTVLSLSTTIFKTMRPSTQIHTTAVRLSQKPHTINVQKSTTNFIKSVTTSMAKTPTRNVPASTMANPTTNAPSSATTLTTVVSSSRTTATTAPSSSLTATVPLTISLTATVPSSAKTPTATVSSSTATPSTILSSTTSTPTTAVPSSATDVTTVSSLTTTMTTTVLSSKTIFTATVPSSNTTTTIAVTSSTTTTTTEPSSATAFTINVLTTSQKNVNQAMHTEASKDSSSGMEIQWWHIAIAVGVATISTTGCCIFFCLFLYKRRREEEEKNKIRAMPSDRDIGEDGGNINPSFYRPPPPTKRPSICQPLIPTTPLPYKSPPLQNAWM